MGQAKQRGTFDERRTEAEARIKAENEARRLAHMEREARRRLELASRPAPKRRNGFSSVMLATALAMSVTGYASPTALNKPEEV